MKHQMKTILTIRAIRSFLVSLPVIVLYWQDHGLLMRDIFILQVIFSLSVVVLEVPSGYFADRFGRVNSIKIASVMGTLGHFFYWFFPSFWGFALAEFTLAVSTGFLSGAIEALLQESLPEDKRKVDNKKWQGRMMTTNNLSEASAAVLAGLLAANYGIQTVLVVQFLVLSLSIPLSFKLQETRHLIDRPTPAILKILHGTLRENKPLVALNLYAAGLAAGTLTMVWFAQPLWRELGVNILHFGYMWAGLQLVVALGATLSHKLEAKLTFRHLFTGLAVLLIAGYVVMGISSTNWLALAVIPLFWFIRGVSHPVIVDYVQQEARDEEKATVLSINTLTTRLVFSIFSPFLGWVVDIWSFAMAFYASALIFGIISCCGLLLLYRSYR